MVDFIFVEGAEAWQLGIGRIRWNRCFFEVIDGLAAGELVLGEGDVVIVIEVAAEGGDPGKAPTHARLICCDFSQRGRVRLPSK